MANLFWSLVFHFYEPKKKIIMFFLSLSILLQRRSPPSSTGAGRNTFSLPMTGMEVHRGFIIGQIRRLPKRAFCPAVRFWVASPFREDQRLNVHTDEKYGPARCSPITPRQRLSLSMCPEIRNPVRFFFPSPQCFQDVLCSYLHKCDTVEKQKKILSKVSLFQKETMSLLKSEFGQGSFLLLHLEPHLNPSAWFSGQSTWPPAMGLSKHQCMNCQQRQFLHFFILSLTQAFTIIYTRGLWNIFLHDSRWKHPSIHRHPPAAQGPPAESKPTMCPFMWPTRAWKVYDHLKIKVYAVLKGKQTINYTSHNACRFVPQRPVTNQKGERRWKEVDAKWRKFTKVMS